MNGGFIVSRVATCPVEGLSVRTFAEGGVHRFAAKGTRARATELVIHETVTRSVDSTIAVLKKRGLSVHLVMGADGALTQHGDLATDILWHASQHNGPSFGVEVVNPYYPGYLKPGLPWSRSIKAPWAHKGEYVLPTPAQAEAVAALVRWTAANRDPRRFATPDSFEPVVNAPHNLVYGIGSHVCPGRALATSQLREALAALLRSSKTIRLAERAPLRAAAPTGGDEHVWLRLS